MYWLIYMLDSFKHFSYAELKIPCITFGQSPKSNQKLFSARFKGRPVTDKKTKRKNSLERSYNPN